MLAGLVLGLFVVLLWMTSSQAEEVRVFSGRDWEVIGPNATYDVSAIFIPDMEYRVECSCTCESFVYSHEMSTRTGAIPTGRFVRLRVWNACFDKNLVVIRGTSPPGYLVSMLAPLMTICGFVAEWPRFLSAVVILVGICLWMRVSPIDVVRDFMYLEPLEEAR
jgi:hypothetical protein